MEQMFALSPDEIDDILTEEADFYCPDPEGLKKGDRLHIHHKVGGNYELVNITIKKAPYPKSQKSKTILVDVYGYGVSGPTNVKYLRKKK